MEVLYDPQAPKKPTILSINSDLKQILTEKKAEQWRLENRPAIQAYNVFVEKMVVSVTTTGISNVQLRGFDSEVFQNMLPQSPTIGISDMIYPAFHTLIKR